MLKRTALFAAHQRLGARLVDFGGWEMPVQYTSIVDEHQAVRHAAGLFDISHMGQVSVRGVGALPWLNRLLTNDVRRLEVGQGQYSLLCNERGGVIDDLYLYRLAVEEYLLIINASRIEPDLAWLEQQSKPETAPLGVHWEDHSGRCGALALQGPAAVRCLESCLAAEQAADAGEVGRLRKNEVCIRGFEGAFFRVARTGYTGEDGFELFGPSSHLEALWRRLLEVGPDCGLKPCGLGARDTLRTEMAYPLYGHELDENTTPLEAGLSAFVALDKGDFIGREALARQKAHGVGRRCVAFIMTETSPPPRPGYPLWGEAPAQEPIGSVVSGTQSPSLGKGIGMGYVPPGQAKSGLMLRVGIRGKRYAASIVRKPIYHPAGHARS